MGLEGLLGATQHRTAAKCSHNKVTIKPAVTLPLLLISSAHTHTPILTLISLFQVHTNLRRQSPPCGDNSSYFTSDGFPPRLNDIASWHGDRSKAQGGFLSASKDAPLHRHTLTFIPSKCVHVCALRVASVSQAKMLERTRLLPPEFVLLLLAIFPFSF